MDKMYISLFTELCNATEITAEQVMDYDKQKEDEKGYEIAEMMRNDYRALKDKISAGESLTKNDFAKLLASVYIVTNNLRDRITNMQRAIRGYEKDVLPKLKDIVDNATDDEDAYKKANESFIIEVEEEEK